MYIINDKFKIRFFSVVSIILLCIAFTVKEFQNDTFYIIKIGDYIWNNGIDFLDHYCFIANLSYTYPHWLYDVFMYLIYNNFDNFGVYLSSVISFIVLILSVYFINLKFNKNELMATIVSILIISLISGFVTARSQTITAILFLWQVYFIERLVLLGNRKYLFFLSLISLLVANLHATIWPFYFILYLPFLGHQIIYIIVRKFKIRVNDKLIINNLDNFKLVIVSMILGLFMGFLSPSRICFTYVFKIMAGDSQSYIVEHAPMVLINNIYFLLFILVLLMVLIFSKTKITLKELFMLGGLILMSLSSFRHVAFFYLIGLLYLSFLCNRYLLDNKDRSLDVLFSLLVRNNFIYLLLIFGVVLFSIYKFQKNFSCDYIPLNFYPVEQVDYIKSNLDVDSIRLYNDYNYGSYLLFKDIPVFIDSRSDLYLKEFNGMNYSIFDEAMNIFDNYEKTFKKYDISHVLISKNDSLYKVMIKDSNYFLLNEDDNFVLFEKVIN